MRAAGKSDDRDAGGREDLLRSISIWLFVVTLLALLVNFVARGGNLASGPAPPTPLGPVLSAQQQSQELCGEAPKNGRSVLLTLAYGPEIKTFIEAASERFEQRCPHIEVRHQVMDEISAAAAIASGAGPSTIWIAGNELALSLATRPMDSGLAQAAPILFSSPYVFVAWEDRAQLLQRLLRSPVSGEGAWMQLSCPLLPRAAGEGGTTEPTTTAVSWVDWYRASILPPARPPARRAKWRAEPVPPPSEETSGALAETQAWGPVKFRHAAPVRAALGLGALSLVAYDYLRPPQARAQGPATAADLSRALQDQAPALQVWLRRCRGALGALPETEAGLIREFEEQGAARSDVIAVREHAALSLLSKRAAHGAAVRGLRILYPATSLRGEYRAVLTARPGPGQQAVAEIAHKWIAFLLRDDMQRLAIEQGLRPTTGVGTIRDHDVPANPFLSLRHRGVELSPSQEPPPALDAAAARRLMRIWEDAVLSN